MSRKPHDNEYIVKQLRMESQDEHEDGYHGRGNMFSDAADAIEQNQATTEQRLAALEEQVAMLRGFLNI